MCVCVPQLTHLQAGKGERVLADKLVVRGTVVVLHDEADQGQLRYVHVKRKALVPCRVEP